MFGLATVAIGPTVTPRRRGHPNAETLRIGDRQERGVGFPYATTVSALLLVSRLLMGLGMLSIVVLTDAPPPIRLVGLVGVPLLVQVVVLVALRGVGRRWRIVLTPSAVVHAPVEVATVVPWAAIAAIAPFSATHGRRGVTAKAQAVRLLVNDPRAVQRSRLTRALTVGARRDAVFLPVGALDVAPTLLFRTLGYYLRHPAARHELAADSGLPRVRHGGLDRDGDDGDGDGTPPRTAAP